MRTTSRYAVTAIGADRPGIVAAITGALVEHDCNLEDTEMSVLGGQFTMMLIVSGPNLDVDRFEADLRTAGAPLDVDVSVRAVPDAHVEAVPPADAEVWTLSVHGADHPGIVHSVSQHLLDRGLSIEDLRSRLIGTPDAPIFVMFLDVVVAGGAVPELQASLSALGAEVGIEIDLHSGDATVF